MSSSLAWPRIERENPLHVLARGHPRIPRHPGAALVAILAMQPACIAKINARCALVTDGRPAPALPSDFAPLDGLLYQRAIQMMHDVRGLNGSPTVSFHIWFAYETLPLWCARMDQARELAMAGQVAAAGRKYQALLVSSQLMELAIAVHAVVEYADAIKEPSLVLVQTLETFGNQMEPILAAVLSEDPREIERALKARPEVFQQWRDYLERWMVHIRADAERMKVAKVVWDVTIGVIAAYESAGSLARLVTSGRPPMPPLPALATIGVSSSWKLLSAGHLRGSRKCWSSPPADSRRYA